MFRPINRRIVSATGLKLQAYPATPLHWWRRSVRFWFTIPPLLHQVLLHASTTGITTHAVHGHKTKDGKYAVVYRQYHKETVFLFCIAFDHSRLLNSLAKEAKDIQADPPVGVR